MIRRAKKLNKKPDEASDGSDSGEDQTQPKKVKVKMTTRMKSIENEDSENVPTSAVKKDKPKMKKASKPEGLDEEIMEKPKQMVKKIKGKKPVKSIEPEEDAAISSDIEPTQKPKQASKRSKILGKKAVNSDQQSSTNKIAEEKPEDSSGITVSEEKLSKTINNKIKKKVLKQPDAAESSKSDEENTEKPKQMAKKIKRKKPVKSIEPEEDAANSSDIEPTQKPKQASKRSKILGKKAVKSDQQSSTNKIAEEKPEDSSGIANFEEKCSKTIKKEIKTKVLKQPGAAAFIKSDDDRSTIKKKIKALKRLKAEALLTSDAEVKPKIQNYLSDSELSSDSGIKQDVDNYNDSMKNLKSIDPDFYKFLQLHDSELFDIDEHALDERESDEDMVVHVPNEKLHVDSDESDFEDVNSAPVKGKVTQQMITDLNNKLINEDAKMKLSTIVLATKLFNGAVRRATSEDGSTEGEFKVSGTGVFNNIINMCVLYLPNAIKRYLGIEHSQKNPARCKHFVKIKSTLVQYLSDLMKLLTAVTSESILIVMLKHLHNMATYVLSFVRIAKRAVKTLLPLWTSGTETVRVLSFVCILRLVRNQSEEFLSLMLKTLYMTYVKNCKFVSPSTWPGINFMRRSLVELFLLNIDISYPIVFIYIRQLGILLRNAIMVPKRENTQAVYNWQFLNSLHLWAVLIPQTMHQANMKSLIFPLTMIISNTIKMKPTPQYYPVRFYLTEMLMKLSSDSGTFIPIQGYLMDVLMKFDFNKKQKKVSMKPLDFSCVIRLNKTQMSENSFKDAVMERMYALLLEYATDISCELSFPDVTMILLIYLRDVVNKCTVANYKRKFKQLQDKIEEGADFIRKLRFDGRMSLRDGNVVRAEQKRIKAVGTPLMAFYENWSKVNNIQKRKIITKNDILAGEIPVIKRRKISEEADKIVVDKTDRPMTLFSSDSEDEKDDFKTLVENDEAPKDKSKQKMKRKRNNKETVKQNEDKSPDVAQNEDKNPDVADGVPDVGDIVQEFSW